MEETAKKGGMAAKKSYYRLSSKLLMPCNYFLVKRKSLILIVYACGVDIACGMPYTYAMYES